MRYAELHCLSNFTFLRGASHPEELVKRAAELGYAALALTDECSLAGVVRAHQEAKEAGIKLIVGAELHLSNGPRLVLLAREMEGYSALAQLITRGRRSAEKGDYRLTRADLADGVVGCLALWIPSPDSSLEEGQWVADHFPGCAWIAVEIFHAPDDMATLQRLRQWGRELGLPLTAAGDVHMHLRRRKPLQDLVTAIRLGTPVAQCGHALFPNAERHLRSIASLGRLYPLELLEESARIAEQCRFSLDELRYEYPAEVVPAGATPTGHLRRLTEEGLKRRYPEGIPDKVRGLIEHELALIAEMHYEPYFLTVHDIVAFARRQGILCQGRGSAANSAVCYALGITEVDPSRMETLFERFISKERNEPPDIDVDFEHERREEVIQYIYAKYGRERAALAATVITYRPRSAIRDVGKALGMDLEQVDRLAKNHAWWDGQEVQQERLREEGFDPEEPKIALLLRLVDELIGFPRHLSQHVGGFVIANGLLSRLVPIENASMPERTVIQWDKDDLDAMGLLKIDILALGMLSAIRRTLALVSQWRGRPMGLADIPAEDPATYEMIGRADTVGVFQIESRAQMTMLPRLKPRLVIEVAIVRPGPIQGGMVHPFLARHQGLEPVTYPNTEVEEVLSRTLGVPIFQEQVIKLAMVAAGFTAGEADALRRAIGAWRKRDDLGRFRQKLLDGMTSRGYDAQFAEQIYRQIEGFGEYGFPESHAASFALLAYASAWLKCHEPAAFLCALLNSYPMGFYAPAQLIQDGKRHGIEVLPVDVTVSGWECTLERASTRGAEPAVRIGMRYVKGLPQSSAETIVGARNASPFQDIRDFLLRTGLEGRSLESLAAANALSTLAGDRHQSHWQVLGAQLPPPLFSQASSSTALSESAPLRRGVALPVPTEGEELLSDYRSLGFTLGRHPLALLRSQLRRRRLVTAEQLRRLPHGAPVRYAGIVTTRQRPGSANGVIFLTLEDETGVANAIVWPKVIDRYRRIVIGGSLVEMLGEVQREGEVIHIIAKRLADLTPMLGNLETSSRDFH